jgi:hypothetical protein
LPYQPVASTVTRNDTLVFAVSLADSIDMEGSYPLKFRAVDNAGRVSVHDFTLTYDLTAPAPPVLTSPGGTSRAQQFALSGSVDNGGDALSVVRFVRNGTVVDSLSTATSNQFTVAVPLEVGRNVLTAVQRDGAGNVGPPSNAVIVNFKSNAGLYFPVPFAPGASFQVNAATTAASAALRVFDVTGNLVTLFQDDTARLFYAFDWNGQNSSDQPVRRGPLVAVATVTYADGTRDVFREVFLFDPDAQ